MRLIYSLLLLCDNSEDLFYSFAFCMKMELSSKFLYIIFDLTTLQGTHDLSSLTKDQTLAFGNKFTEP